MQSKKPILLIVAILAVFVMIGACLAPGIESRVVVEKEYQDSISQSDIDEIQKSAKNGADVTVTISSGDSQIILDTDAVLNLNSAATLTVNPVPASEQSEKVKGIVGDAPVYDISLGDNKDFGSGTVTIVVPYTLAPGDDPDNIMVYYLDSNGDVGGKYYGVYKDGKVSFKTGHLSNYAIMKGDVASEIANSFTYSGTFGNYATVEKKDARLYSVTSPVNISTDPTNTIYVYAGADAKDVHEKNTNLIRNVGKFFGAQPKEVYCDGLNNFTIYKTDADSYMTATMVYFSLNIGDVTIYAVGEKDGKTDTFSGVAKTDELATDKEIMTFVRTLMSSIDGKVWNIAIGSAQERANAFISSYSNGPLGGFSGKNMSESSATATNKAGSVKWTVSANAYSEYKAITTALEAKNGLTKMNYNGHDYVSVYTGGSSYYFVLYTDGMLVTNVVMKNGIVDEKSALKVDKLSSTDIYNLSNFLSRSVGIKIYEGDAYTLLDAVEDFVNKTKEYYTFGAWSYSDDTTNDSSILRYDYVGRQDTDKFNQITITKYDDPQKRYNELAAKVLELDDTYGPMSLKYHQFNKTIGKAQYTAVMINGSSMGGGRFVMLAGDYVIDATGFGVDDKDFTAYVYFKSAEADEQNSMMESLLKYLDQYISKTGKPKIESADTISMAARFATNFKDGKTTWWVAKDSTDDVAHLIGKYKNNNGNDRFFDITISNEPDVSNAYGDLSERVNALDGTTFLKSTNYSLYDKTVDDITYSAVAYSGSSMGAFRFVMCIGNILVDATGLEFENEYPYIYVVSSLDTFDAEVANLLTTMKASILSTEPVDIDAVTEKDDDSGDDSGDDTPDDQPAEKQRAIIAAWYLVLNHSVDETTWNIADGATATEAKVIESYVAKGKTQTKEFKFFTGDYDKYTELATATAAYDGQAAMGSNMYASIDYTIPGVSVTACGAKISTSSYYIKVTMYCDGLIFDTGESLVYLKGDVGETEAKAVMNVIADALKAAAPEKTGAAKAGEEFVKNVNITGTTWSVKDGSSETSTTLVETYEAKGKTQTKQVTIITGDMTKYTELATATAAYDGQAAMGSNMYASIDYTIPGVTLTACGAKISTSSYYIKVTMYCDGLIFDTGESLVYLKGDVGETEAKAVMDTIADALKAAAPEKTGAAKVGAEFVKNVNITGTTWSVKDGSSETSTTLVETYEAKGKTQTKQVTIFTGDMAKYTELATATAAYDGQAAMGSNMYALLSYNLDGVSITACGAKISTSSYYVKLTMFCDGVIFDTGEQLVYLKGDVGEDEAKAVMDCLANAFYELVKQRYFN